MQVFLRKKHLKKTVYGKGKKVSKPKIQIQSEENIIKSIRNLFILKKENKREKRYYSKKEIKYRIIRDIRTLLEQEDYYYKPIRVANFVVNVEYESNGDRNKIKNDH